MSTGVRSCISVKNHVDQFVVHEISIRVNQVSLLDHVSVLRIVLMSACSKSYINMSKSDLSVRSVVSVKNHVDVCLQQIKYQHE